VANYFAKKAMLAKGTIGVKMVLSTQRAQSKNEFHRVIFFSFLTQLTKVI
jgi:hypothetical protein